MYEDTILPVRNNFSIPDRCKTRIYFVQEQTKKSLAFIKWIELIMCLLCVSFAVPSVNYDDLTVTSKFLIIISSSSSTLIVLIEILYPYFKKSFPLILQVLVVGICFAIHLMLGFVIYLANPHGELIKVLLFTDGIAAILFLVDFICKIIISTYLYQTTRVKSMVDVAINAAFPSPGPYRPKGPRSVLTPTPITHGGTFPIGRDEHPFLPEDRNQPMDETISSKNRSVQTAQFGDSVSIGKFDFSPAYVDRSGNRPRVMQLYVRQEDKGTSTVPPFYLDEDRRKKSPWTCSTPNSSRKVEAKKQAPMSTPITYSGTFAVNKELVPITPEGITGTSPKSSPRIRKTHSRSEGSSPNRAEHAFIEIGRLDQISEEKMSGHVSSDNCSASRSNSAVYILPGTVLQECDYEMRH